MSDWQDYKNYVRINNPEIGKDIDEIEKVSAILGETVKQWHNPGSSQEIVKNKNQLVTVQNDNETMIVSFTEANRRIVANAKNKVSSVSPVDDESTEDLLKTISEGTEQLRSTNDKGVFGIKNILKSELAITVDTVKENCELLTFDMEQYLLDFVDIASNVANYKKELNKKLGETDKKINGVLHYVELCDVDETEEHDLIELLRVCRENRRIYKDEIFKAEAFQRNLGNGDNISSAKMAVKSIRDRENRQYVAREFFGLFQNGVIPYHKNHRDKRISKSHVFIVSESRFYKNAEEEMWMDYTKKQTPYDGKGYDWLEFARTQAEFYENANQYIINLEIELEEMDKTIESLLDEIEMAHCNVTQGYKMFKKLQELRQMRTKKNTKIRILHQLTDHLNLQAMAKESRNSVVMIGEMLCGNMAESDHEGIAECKDL